MRSLLVLCGLSLPGVGLASIPLGEKIDDGVLVDVTDDGLDAVVPAIRGAIPSSIDVPTVNMSGGGSCAARYSIYSDNLEAFVSLQSVDISPGTDALQVVATAEVWVNSQSAPAQLDYSGALICIPFSGTCDVWVEPIQVEITGVIELSLVEDPEGADFDGDGTPDTKMLDADVLPLEWSWDATGDNIELDDCPTINTLIDVLDFFTLDIRQIVLDQVEGEIDNLVQSLPTDFEPLIEDAFSGLVISEQIDLLGAQVSLDLWPESMVIQPTGMRVSLGSVVGAETDPCIDRYGFQGSRETAGQPPDLQHSTAPVVAPHVVALADDDFANHFLFGVWSTGLLCLDLGAEDSPVDLPVPLDSTLLSLLAGDAFDRFFPESQPLDVVTDPRQPPEVDLTGPNDVNVMIDPLGLDIGAEVDGRKARLVSVDVVGNIGVDVAFDPATGELAPNILVEEGSITPSVVYNEFAPEASASIEGGLTTLIDTLAISALGGITNGVAVAIPALEGFGLTDMVVEPTGSTGDHLGAFSSLGQVSYPSAGCSQGCGGCSSGGGIPASAIVLLFPALVALRRRRR